jgi:uracil phosphoribosyltransferase
LTRSRLFGKVWAVIGVLFTKEEVMKIEDCLQKYPNLTLLPQTRQLIALMTKIRDCKTKRGEFRFYAKRIIRPLVEKGLELLPTNEKVVITPTGEEFLGREFEGRICGVSIMRAGESMEEALQDVCKNIRIGKILIQRDEETAQPKLMYEKLPRDIKHRHVLLLDPMLATGGSAICAINLLKEKDVKVEKIIFINLISCFQGIDNVFQAHPQIRIVTAAVDPVMNEKMYIVPGLGDFGDRYYHE